jgi:mono/diheme cytochrome c family protein
VRTANSYVVTDEDGSFLIEDLKSDQPVILTAWAPGYFIVATEDLLPGDASVIIHLERHFEGDNTEYEWVSPYSTAGEEANCQNCHSDDSGTLPFEEWLDDAHSQTLSNPRLLTLYSGTDLEGNQSPLTRYVDSKDYDPHPLPPDPELPYYGAGYKLDFPETQGNCAACHAPGAAVDAPYQTDPTLVVEDDTAGIHCDFCHKIWDVRLDPDTGLPYNQYPGVLSYESHRPPEGGQFFAGPLDDVAPGEDTYSPLQLESAYCAGCHYATFWDTVIYNSYGEWLDSPYSNPITGQTCQDCHMPSLGASYFAVPEKGGLERDPGTIASHRTLGIRDQDFMENALSLNAEVEEKAGEIILEVTLVNDNTGHKIPTDSPLRNLLLLVTALDQDGNPLVLVFGPQLPDWAGADTDAGKAGHYGGLPGKGFALVLRENWTGISPTAAYWNPVQVVEDTRLAPFQEDYSQYRFQAPEQGPATIQVQLIFRRAFIEIAEMKGWGVEDLVLQVWEGK